MKIADQIANVEANLVSKKDQLVGVLKSLEQTPDDDGLLIQSDSLSGEVESITKRLASLKSAEQALAAKAPAIVQSKHLGSHDDAKSFFYREAAVRLAASVQNKSVEQVVSERYSKDDTFKDYLVSKATQNPAQTNVPGYVQELVQPVALQGFMDDLRPASVIARLPFFQVSFGANNWAGAKFIWRDRSKKAAAAYRAEGAPAVVRGLQFTSKTLPPYLMSVITHATKEAVRYSTGDLEGILRNAMIEDTAEYLDTSVLSDMAAVSGVSPAGLLVGVTPKVSAGQDYDQVQADVRAMLAPFIAANATRRLYWVMNSSTVLQLQGVLNALGDPAYAAELATGRFAGLPFVASTTVDKDVIILIETAEVAFALSAPEISTSMEATLHEEDTAPAQVGGSTTPVRSLFQTNSWAIKTDWVESHLVMRTPAVGILDISAWV
jgi:HK97 family phage major capsid protein